MARSPYTFGKRQREADKARKKKEKAERKAQRREAGPGDDIVSAEEITGALPSAEEAMRAMEERASAPRRAAAIPCRLFVGGLSWDTSGETLEAAFGKFGAVVEAVIMRDRDTGRSRGFGFVTMENRKEAAKAIDSLHGSEIDGRDIIVNVATERSR